MAEFQNDPQMRNLLRLRTGERAREEFVDFVAGAKTRGEVRPDVDADILFDSLVGAVFLRIMIEGERPLGRYAQNLADLLLRGVRPAATR